MKMNRMTTWFPRVHAWKTTSFPRVNVGKKTWFPMGDYRRNTWFSKKRAWFPMMDQLSKIRFSWMWTWFSMMSNRKTLFWKNTKMPARINRMWSMMHTRWSRMRYRNLFRF